MASSGRVIISMLNEIVQNFEIIKILKNFKYRFYFVDMFRPILVIYNLTIFLFPQDPREFLFRHKDFFVYRHLAIGL